MINNHKEHFKFESRKELIKASFNHRRYHGAVLSKDDLDLLGWIVMHNLGHVGINVREKVHTLFNLPLDTIDHSLEKLITLGIIERTDTDIYGIPTPIYPMLPFNRKLDETTAFREPEKGKRIFIIDEDFRRFLASTEDITTVL